jgi:hypothetical protein
VKVWNVGSGKCLRRIEKGSHPIIAIAFGIEPSHVLCCYEQPVYMDSKAQLC